MALEVQNPRPETRKGGVREDYRASLIVLISLVPLNRTPTVFFLDASHSSRRSSTFLEKNPLLKPSSLRLFSGLFILSHTNDYVSCFLSRVDVPVSFGSLFQRIASVYYGSYLSGFDELFEED